MTLESPCTDGLTGYRDAQWELVESLLSGRRVHSYAELSLCPVVRRQWSSIYTGIRAGRQNRKQVRQLMYNQLPAEGGQLFALDTTVWPHPTCTDTGKPSIGAQSGY